VRARDLVGAKLVEIPESVFDVFNVALRADELELGFHLHFRGLHAVVFLVVGDEGTLVEALLGVHLLVEQQPQVRGVYVVVLENVGHFFFEDPAFAERVEIIKHTSI